MAKKLSIKSYRTSMYVHVDGIYISKQAIETVRIFANEEVLLTTASGSGFSVKGGAAKKLLSDLCFNETTK